MIWKYANMIIPLVIVTWVLLVSDNNSLALVFNEREEFKMMENQIIDKTDRWEINIFYPQTNYALVNRRIDKIIDNYISYLKESLKDYAIFPMTLDITYREDGYLNYLSYTFNIVIFTGGAHPNYYTETIVYDTYNNSIVTINDLKMMNPNILEYLSQRSRNYFLKMKIFDDPNIRMMLDEGTAAREINFSKFVFTEKGMLIYFERYQIAPYAYGEYHIIIPYQELRLKL